MGSFRRKERKKKSEAELWTIMKAAVFTCSVRGSTEFFKYDLLST